MSEMKDVEQQLKLSQDRVRELEAELSAQQVCSTLFSHLLPFMTGFLMSAW